MKKEAKVRIDPVIGFITQEVEGRIAKSAMVAPPTKSINEKAGYHSQSIINRTDVLTWTSKKGHTNQVDSKSGSQTDSK